MSKEELENLVLVSCNRTATVAKGREYDNELDAMIYLCTAIDYLFAAFDIAQMNVKSTAPDFSATQH